MPERRTAHRYDLSLPIVVQEPAGRRLLRWKGITRNISARGMYLMLDSPDKLKPRRGLNFKLRLPVRTSGGRNAIVRAHGTVLRIERYKEGKEERLGIALEFEKYILLRAKRPAS